MSSWTELLAASRTAASSAYYFAPSLTLLNELADTGVLAREVAALPQQR